MMLQQQGQGQPPRTAIMSSAGRPMTSSQSFFTTNTLPSNLYQIPDGKFTFTIYSLIKQHRFEDVVKVLEHELQTRTPSRSALALLAYAQYQLQDFENASQTYMKLLQLVPQQEQYKLYLAQCYYKLGKYDEAVAVSLDISEDSVLIDQVQILQFAIRFELSDTTGCRRSLFDMASVGTGKNEYAKLVGDGCLAFKEMKFREAVESWSEALAKFGPNTDINYNLALGFYALKDYIKSLEYIADVIEEGIKEHPEFEVDMSTTRKLVANSQSLHESRLIEAYNLRAAIEYKLINLEASKDALMEMPARKESDLDHISLHNKAVLESKTEPEQSFDKLSHLLSSDYAPPPTMMNALLLCIQHDLYDIAADFLAQVDPASLDSTDPFMGDFIQASVVTVHSPEEAIQKLDQLIKQLTDDVNTAMQQVQDARDIHDEEMIKEAVDLYDKSIDRYLSVVMSKARIYWKRKEYDLVEDVLKASMDILSDRDEWRTNVGHVLFAREKYQECISFFQPVLNKNAEKLTKLPAITVANACVAYILTNQNELAESLMAAVEQEEAQLMEEAEFIGNTNQNHTCIINLVIGVLYCSRGNYEFGLSRIITSFDPIPKKLNSETWFIAKKCLVSLLEILVKQMLLLKDASLQELLDFLDKVDTHGADLPSRLEAPINSPDGNITISAEARKLKFYFARLYETI